MSWALVTGASSGIGRALAQELAAHGHDVVLVGRNEGALGEAAAECAKRGAPRTRVYRADLAEPARVAALVEELRRDGVEVSVLVNNAGFGMAGDFAAADPVAERALIETQIHAALALTRAFLPGMVARKSGGILNVASVYSFTPVPKQLIYAASKAFLLSWAEALAVELEGTGVSVTTVCPGVTRTEFRKRAGLREKSGAAGMSAEEVARFSYAAFVSGKRIAVPGMVNRIFIRVCRILPASWIAGLLRRLNRSRGIHA